MIFDIAGESKEIISTFGSPIYYRKNSIASFLPWIEINSRNKIIHLIK
jgi:hypothetical protein